MNAPRYRTLILTFALLLAFGGAMAATAATPAPGTAEAASAELDLAALQATPQAGAEADFLDTLNPEPLSLSCTYASCMADCEAERTACYQTGCPNDGLPGWCEECEFAYYDCRTACSYWCP